MQIVNLKNLNDNKRHRRAVNNFQIWPGQGLNVCFGFVNKQYTNDLCIFREIQGAKSGYKNQNKNKKPASGVRRLEIEEGSFLFLSNSEKTEYREEKQTDTVIKKKENGRGNGS